MIAATMQTSAPIIDRDGIAATERLIRPYIRRTPTVSVDPGDFGLATTGSLALKLETFQLIGSKKICERGAALTSRLQSFETELLTEGENLAGLAAWEAP